MGPGLRRDDNRWRKAGHDIYSAAAAIPFA